MGQCASTGKSGSTSHNSYYSAATSPTSSPERQPTARSHDEGVLAGLSRRNNQAGNATRGDRATHVVDFSASQVEQQTITTPGQTLRTSALDLCTGVAVGGVRYNHDGSISDSSVSVFHVLPNVRMPGVAVARQINELRSAGFNVNAYVAGGDGTSQAGRQQRSAMEGMLQGMDVPYQSGPLSDGQSSQYLSAAIQESGEIDYENSRGSY
ncbi:hypothetical protein [Acidovorax sp. NCPPB 3576]|uniref:hypothetical protein n=1 Tax=Acidovorax sp. NCPPB 3576 TaxID=2940488 RepID=UPI00234BEB8C|nr:hypothetical protein [Acidovorax sp. NCPPB 3576]WCM90582.1 hypothetical protein M5C98_11435 [Acidovorax sp. NCPPB 3576]